MNARIAVAVFLLGIGLARAEVIVGKWQPIFRGVELATGFADSSEGRMQRVWAVRVDLRAPDIEFFSTPANGDAPEETTSETTTEFLQHHRLQLAINANFYAPCCTPGDKDLLGLAMAQGEVVSPPRESGIGHSALVITRDNRAQIVDAGAGFDPKPYWTAIAGSNRVLVNGQRPEFPATAFNTTGHPRTAVGLSKGERYLILLIIDGRQPGWSEGAPMESLATWMERFGAYNALNLDGGGSTALVRLDAGKPLTLNRPSGVSLGSADNLLNASGERRQRSNGNNFGLWAKPL